jgi:hypothetical protein
MKKMIAMTLLCTFAMGAHADELADGMKAWEKRDFAQAQQIYTRLAQAGNVQAQLLLGELYGFGEGMAEDQVQAEKWLSKAQAGGSPDAAASLAAMRQRVARKADIARYVNGDPSVAPGLAKLGCAKPVYPEVSRTRAEIRAVEATSNAWRSCFDRFAMGQIPVKAIPEDLAGLMSLSELDRANLAIDKAVVIAANAEAKDVIAAYDGWYERTQHLGLEMEKVTKDQVNQRKLAFDKNADRIRASAWIQRPGHD